jgi:hypothetical protein
MLLAKLIRVGGKKRSRGYIIAVILRYSPNENILDLRNALTGTVVFGMVFFLLHPFVDKRVKG